MANTHQTAKVLLFPYEIYREKNSKHKSFIFHQTQQLLSLYRISTFEIGSSHIFYQFSGKSLRWQNPKFSMSKLTSKTPWPKHLRNEVLPVHFLSELLINSTSALYLYFLFLQIFPLKNDIIIFPVCGLNQFWKKKTKTLVKILLLKMLYWRN